VAAALESSNSILITGHIDPDGDSLGSVTALLEASLSICQEVFWIEQGAIPEKYNFLSLFNERAALKIDFEEICSRSSSYDLLIALDCGAYDRISVPEDIGEHIKILNIDHHIPNEMFGDLNYVYPASATCELIFDLLNYMQIEINSQIAEPLYVGLLTDTGSFRYPNTSSKTFKIAGKLLNTGFSHENVIDKVYNSSSLSSMKLTGLVLSSIERNEKMPGLISMEVTESMMEEVNAEREDVQGLANFLNKIKDLHAGFLLTEEKNKIKVSLRSKGDIAVNEIASEFGGGGHRNAAGFEVEGQLNEVKKNVYRAFEKYY